MDRAGFREGDTTEEQVNVQDRVKKEVSVTVEHSR